MWKVFHPKVNQYLKEYNGVTEKYYQEYLINRKKLGTDIAYNNFCLLVHPYLVILKDQIIKLKEEVL